MYRHNYYKNDPRWIDVRYSARCSCGREIRRGDRGFYFPTGKTVVCETCGLAAEKMLIDDDMNRVLKVR